MKTRLNKRRLIRILLMVVVFAMITTISANAQSNRAFYSIERGMVYFNGQPMPYADVATFQILGYGYAKDRQHVYMDGYILEYVEPLSFRLKDEQHHPYAGYGEWDRPPHTYGYYKTKFNVFFNGRKIEDASASTFKELDEGYAKDSFNVYYLGKKINDASASTFRILGGGYSKDAFNVYFYGKEIPDASASTFKYDGSGYAHDAFDTYYNGRKIGE